MFEKNIAKWMLNFENLLLGTNHQNTLYTIVGDKITYPDINTEDIPRPIFKYYSGRRNKPFILQLLSLENELKKYNPDSNGQEYFKLLFLLLIYYYQDRQSEFYELEDKLLKHDYLNKQDQLIKYLKYSIIDLNNIIIISNSTYTESNNLYRLKKLTPGINIKIINKQDTVEKIINIARDYNQVFFTGHGGDGYFYINEKPLEESHFNQLYSESNVQPSVLGIFSCNRIIQDNVLMTKIDFYLTDDEISVPDYSEMFLWGYLKNYFRSKSVEEAYWAGRVTPFFRRRIEPEFILYTNGIEIK